MVGVDRDVKAEASQGWGLALRLVKLAGVRSDRCLSPKPTASQGFSDQATKELPLGTHGPSSTSTDNPIGLFWERPTLAFLRMPLPQVIPEWLVNRCPIPIQRIFMAPSFLPKSKSQIGSNPEV